MIQPRKATQGQAGQRIAPAFAQESAKKRRAEAISEWLLFGWVALMILSAIAFCSVGGLK